MEVENNQNNQIEITPEFYQLLKQYTGSQDPLEDPNFDVAAYLNEKFPDFKSLDNINSLIEKFEKEIGELDEEIDGLMCERATYNDELKNYMQELNNDVGKIIQLISNIKQNTDTNETTVKLICNDIKNLDNARNNITVTISSLTKLIMLITGIEKLESFVKEKQYKEAANAIAASNDIMEYFKEYRHVTQVNSLYQKKDALCNSLLNTICEELKNDIGLLPDNSDRLYDACLAINAIGDRAISEIKTWFTQFKLAPYEKMFDPKIENAIEFKDTEKRFDWIKRALKEYDKLYDEVFPPSWGFKSQLCQEFCRITKLQLNEILMMNVEGIKNIEVEVLVKVLNSTISFEKSLNEYLISEYPLTEENIKSNFLDMNIIEEIRSKYQDVKKERNKNRKDPNDKPRYRLFRVIGIISESFEPYMNSYVTNEEKKIKDIIINLVQNDRIEGKLYVSSLYLFNNIKQAMSRCLTFSKSKTFFDLSIKFKDIFLFYIEKILNQKFNLNFYSNEINKNKNLKQADFTPICYLINTCDYCITTIGALTSSVQEKIEPLLPKAKSMIIDLLNNKGGVTTAENEISNMFLDSGIVNCYYYNGEEFSYKMRDTDDKIKLPTVILVNGNTASSSEIMTALFMQNHGDTTVVGTQTFGKGVFQDIRKLSNGDEIMIANGYYTVGDWECYNEVGITPDIVLEMDESLIGTFSDTQLKKALEILG